MEIYYGISYTTFNNHFLTHLVDNGSRLEPFWNNSTFPFGLEMFYLNQLVHNGVRPVIQNRRYYQFWQVYQKIILNHRLLIYMSPIYVKKVLPTEVPVIVANLINLNFIEEFREAKELNLIKI